MPRLFRTIHSGHRHVTDFKLQRQPDSMGFDEPTSLPQGEISTDVGKSSNDVAGKYGSGADMTRQSGDNVKDVIVLAPLVSYRPGPLVQCTGGGIALLTTSTA